MCPGNNYRRNKGGRASATARTSTYRPQRVVLMSATARTSSCRPHVSHVCHSADVHMSVTRPHVCHIGQFSPRSASNALDSCGLRGVAGIGATRRPIPARKATVGCVATTPTRYLRHSYSSSSPAEHASVGDGRPTHDRGLQWLLRCHLCTRTFNFTHTSTRSPTRFNTHTLSPVTIEH